jgi:tetratricopeptide (TPR) repeat protein
MKNFVYTILLIISILFLSYNIYALGTTSNIETIKQEFLFQSILTNFSQEQLGKSKKRIIRTFIFSKDPISKRKKILLNKFKTKPEIANYIILKYTEFLKEQADSFLKQEDFKEAQNLYLELILLNPKNDTFYFNLGLIKKRTKHYEQAIKYFDKAIKLNPNYFKAYYHKLQILIYNLGEYRITRELFEDIETKDFPFQQEPLFKQLKTKFYKIRKFANAGMEQLSQITLLTRLGKLSQAKRINKKPIISNFSEAIKLNPQEASLYYNRAMVYLLSEEKIKAIDDLRLAIKYRPDYELANKILYAELLQQASSLIKTANTKELKKIVTEIFNLKHKPDYNAYFLRIILLSQQEKNIAAIEEIKDLLKQTKDSSSILQLKNLLFDCLLKQAQYHRTNNEHTFALKFYNEAINEVLEKTPNLTFPNKNLLYYERGASYISTENYALAIQDLQKVLSFKPDFEQALKDLKFAEVLYTLQQNDPKQLDIITANLEFLPIKTRKSFNILFDTQEKIKQRQYQEALDLLESSPPELKDNSTSYLLKASIFFHLRDSEKAIEFYNKGLEDPYIFNDPKTTSAIHFSLGSIYTRIHNIEQAKKHLLLSIEIESQVCNNVALASLYVEADDFEKAKKLFDKSKQMLEESPIDIKQSQSASFYNNLGWFYHKQGKLKEAVKNYSLASELNHDLENKEQILENLEDAKQELEFKSYETNPNRIEAKNFWDLGLILQDQENYEQSLSAYQHALDYMQKGATKHPTNSLFKNNLGSLLNNMGTVLLALEKHEEAETKFIEADKLFPNDSEITFNLAFVSFNLGKFTITEELLNKAIKKDPAEPAFFYLRSLTYWQLKKYDLAMNAVEKLKELHPELPLIPILEKNILEEKKEEKEKEEKKVEEIIVEEIIEQITKNIIRNIIKKIIKKEKRKEEETPVKVGKPTIAKKMVGKVVWAQTSSYDPKPLRPVLILDENKDFVRIASFTTQHTDKIKAAEFPMMLRRKSKLQMKRQRTIEKSKLLGQITQLNPAQMQTIFSLPERYLKHAA